MVLMTLIPALGSLRQVDFYKYEATLLYRVSSQTAKATQRKPVSKSKQTSNNDNKFRLKMAL